jgi:hypothetical protein
MGDFIKSIGQFYSYIDKGIWYIVHPKELGLATWRFVDDKSFWVCMIICLASSLGYLCGIEKCKKWSQGSLLIFIAIKMLSSGGIGK